MAIGPGSVKDLTILQNGWVGNYACTHDSDVVSRPNISGGNIRFGMPLMYDPQGDDTDGLPKGVIPVNNTMTDANVAEVFAGFAIAVVKAPFGGEFVDGAWVGGYYPLEAVGVFQHGAMDVWCPNDTPVFGGPVYVRTVANGVRAIGDIESTEVAGENVLIPNLFFQTAVDNRGVVRVRSVRRLNV